MTVFFKFLWSRKPDKIKRSTTCLDYMSGGIKMIDIFSFEKALKVNWIKRILFQQETEWKILLSLTHDGLNSIFNLGGEWSEQMSQKVKNKFWSKVFLNWSELCKLNIRRENRNYCSPVFGTTVTFQRSLYSLQLGLKKALCLWET